MKPQETILRDHHTKGRHITSLLAQAEGSLFPKFCECGLMAEYLPLTSSSTPKQKKTNQTHWAECNATPGQKPGSHGQAVKNVGAAGFNSNMTKSK